MFKVGDTVYVELLDDYTRDCGEAVLRKYGVVSEYDKEDDSYEIIIDGFSFWVEASSLSTRGIDTLKEKVSKEDVLNILYSAKAEKRINYGTIMDIIRQVRAL